jgi:hypothetical protein
VAVKKSTLKIINCIEIFKEQDRDDAEMAWKSQLYKSPNHY